MTTSPDMTENSLWREKAVAFTARSRRELWGRHNEDILSWFFLNGFKNRFIEDMHLGWNKRSGKRPAGNWGFPDDFTDPDTGFDYLLFPPGIVIPWVVDGNLRKLMIFDHMKSTENRCFTVHGSARGPVVYGGKTKLIAVVENIIHGLLLHQEFLDDITVLVPDSTLSFDENIEALYLSDPSEYSPGKVHCEQMEYTETNELLTMVKQLILSNTQNSGNVFYVFSMPVKSEL